MDTWLVWCDGHFEFWCDGHFGFVQDNLGGHFEIDWCLSIIWMTNTYGITMYEQMDGRKHV